MVQGQFPPWLPAAGLESSGNEWKIFQRSRRRNGGCGFLELVGELERALRGVPMGLAGCLGRARAPTDLL